VFSHQRYYCTTDAKVEAQEVEQVSLLTHRLCPLARYGEAALAACSPGTAMKFKELDGARRTVAD